jgi:hypothetical protein
MFENRFEENGGVLGFRDITGSAFPSGYTSGDGHYEQEMADLDGDGDEDLLVADREGWRMLRNDQRSGHGWLKIRGAPVGSTVQVTPAGGATAFAVVLAGGSYLSGPPPERVFGLGSATSADIVVRTPAGTTLRRRVTRPNQTVRFRR